YSIHSYYPTYLLDLLSFPTRRSSDLSTALRRVPAVHMPWAITLGKPKALAPTLETWIGLRSPETAAYSEIRPSSTDLTTVGSRRDRKSTRLNSSHVSISYAVFCLKKK